MVLPKDMTVGILVIPFGITVIHPRHFVIYFKDFVTDLNNLVIHLKDFVTKVVILVTNMSKTPVFLGAITITSLCFGAFKDVVLHLPNKREVSIESFIH